MDTNVKQLVAYTTVAVTTVYAVAGLVSAVKKLRKDAKAKKELQKIS